MKKSIVAKTVKISRRSKLAMEDLRYLQTKITGKSVYKSRLSSYSRRPKHRDMNYQY